MRQSSELLEHVSGSGVVDSGHANEQSEAHSRVVHFVCAVLSFEVVEHLFGAHFGENSGVYTGEVIQKFWAYKEEREGNTTRFRVCVLKLVFGLITNQYQVSTLRDLISLIFVHIWACRYR